MTFISYSQNFEDVLLNRVFKDKIKGFYIDVGALHPTVDSVTKAFYDIGWSGINIEPIKECHNLFEQERSRDINLNIAVSNSQGNLQFFQVIGQPGNSTLNKEIADKIAQEKGLKLSRYTVSVKTLAEVCNEYVDQKIDFLKIDVEGLEEQVILGGNWEIFRPTILVIETTLSGTNIRCENNIPVFLMAKGYQKVFFDGINDYYISEESGDLAKYFSFPINVLDDYMDYRLLEKQRAERIIQLSSQDNIDTQLGRLITPTPDTRKITKIYKSSNKEDYLSVANNAGQIKIALDIAVLGLGTILETAKTGVFRVIEYLLKGLIKSPRCHVYLCTSIPDLFDACQIYINQNFEYQNLPLFQLPELKYQNIDIYHFSSFSLLNNIYFARIRIVTVCDLIPILFPEYFSDNSQPHVINAIDQIANNDFVCCISESTKQDICKYQLNLDEKQVFVTYLAADQEKFYPCDDQELIIKTKEKYKIPDQPYLLTLSTLEPRKNIAHVIRSFLRLIKNQHIDDLNLVLIGTKGWQYEEIFAEVDRAKELENRIIITGYLPDEDLAPLYSGALAFMYVSLYEGFGLPPLEAMQCGTPVITSNTSSLPEVVEDAGIMLDPHDEIGLCDAIFKLYSEPEYREILARKSVQQAQKFSWDKYVQETIKVYELAKEKAKTLPPRNILIDGVFFQLYKTGIARVWRSLLEQWSKSDFANHILVLDRADTAPKINGIRYRIIPAYNYNNPEADKQMLQQICDDQEAELFISSYYTTPINTPSVFMAYDMIPEVLGGNLNEPMWREKHNGIKHASAFIAISENTAKDLSKCFSEIPLESITVAHCGVDYLFSSASVDEIKGFKYKYGIDKPYFLLVGAGTGYKNGILFFQAFSKLATRNGFDIIFTGIGGVLAPELRTYTLGSTIHLLQLSDEELALAYSGAVALVYPSKYEGFGMPVLEAMACGCPVITCANSSITEVAGDAAIYVQDDDVNALVNALCEVQKPSIRHFLTAAGLAQAKKFSWKKMAQTVSSALIDATLLSLNLKEINLIIFPDWSQPEELIGLELQRVIKAIATHFISEKSTLLIDTTNIAIEDAEIFLSSVAMNLLVEEDLDVTEGLEISLVANLADIQWQALLSRIQARIVLKYENQNALIGAKAETLTSYQIEGFSQTQAEQFFLLKQ
ncbi:FkbM family methyltransferase [Nostoc sp. 'Lobaria pulmonaria (5183) cyanobiont']|uniref:FkbM family methyltransferase n=1 Tax=Nostoc sp. 'Lobaria pulmonaria (5183) cyanobiont' TaxID=1618022 RepID=UPI000D0C31A8|nr:FkbM family methyltransferase [Nostoc sp. 'Lobaria pulmonaria (5183) cyanobiont']AVH69732.1 group 1 glycosyltransferase [Nostoc sp. 'Lobaria pulmonaria (5183) cyanobiont']